MELLIFKLKSGIKIKPSHRGLFTDYCNGKVTLECINRGKHSSNPITRKRATFADNARHWVKKGLNGLTVPLVKINGKWQNLTSDGQGNLSAGNKLFKVKTNPLKAYGNDIELIVTPLRNKIVADKDRNKVETPYSSAYHPEDVLEGFNVLTFGGMNNLSPTLWARRAYDLKNVLNGDMSFGKYALNWVNGNNGIVSDNFAKENPGWATAINTAADITTLGLGNNFGHIKNTLLTLSKPKIYNSSNYNINLAASNGFEVTPEIGELVFKDAKNWHLNRISNPLWLKKAAKAGFNNEESALLQLQLSNRIKNLKLSTPPNKNMSILNSGNKGLYWKAFLNKDGKYILNDGIQYDPKAFKSKNDLFNTLIHEIGHGATFGFNGSASAKEGMVLQLMNSLQKQYPLMSRMVDYNMSLIPKTSIYRASSVFPKLSLERLKYYTAPTEMQSRGYEFIKSMDNAIRNIKQTTGLFPKTYKDLFSNKEITSNINNRIFRSIADTDGAINFYQNALGIASPIAIGASLYKNHKGGKLNKFQQGGSFDVVEYIKAIENPNKVGWNGKAWVAPPEGKGYDPNLRGYGIDVEYNVAAKKLTEGRPGRYITDLENDSLMKQHLDYVRDVANRKINGFNKLSPTRLGVILGMLYRGDSVKDINIKEPNDYKFFDLVHDYYRKVGVGERAKLSSEYLANLKRIPTHKIISTLNSDKTLVIKPTYFPIENKNARYPTKKGSYVLTMSKEENFIENLKEKIRIKNLMEKLKPRIPEPYKFKTLKEGGIIKASLGTTFGKINNFLGSDTGKSIINGITSIGSAIKSNKLLGNSAKLAKSGIDFEIKLKKAQAYNEGYNRALDYIRNIQDPNNPNAFGGDIFLNHFANLMANLFTLGYDEEAEAKKLLIDLQMKLLQVDTMSGAINSFADAGMSMLLNLLNKPKFDNSKNNYSISNLGNKSTITTNIGGISTTNTYNIPKANLPTLKFKSNLALV